MRKTIHSFPCFMAVNSFSRRYDVKSWPFDIAKSPAMGLLAWCLAAPASRPRQQNFHRQRSGSEPPRGNRPYRLPQGHHWVSLGITGDHWEQDPGSCVNDWNGQASIYSRAQEKILKPGSPTNGATRAKRDRSAKQTNGKSPQVQNQ